MYCHLQGIVHCDLKLANILIDVDSEDKISSLKIADFGFAFLTTDIQEGGDDSKGTLRYAAPEMLYEEEKFDKRIDVWALGIIIHEILTGKAPFHGASDDALADMIRDEDID